MVRNTRTAFDCPGPKHTSAYVLVHGGVVAGSIVTAWPKGNAGIVRSTVRIYAGPLVDNSTINSTGTARGYGYCKQSAAIEDALAGARLEVRDMRGLGIVAVRNWFTGHGYQLEEIL